MKIVGIALLAGLAAVSSAQTFFETTSAAISDSPGSSLATLTDQYGILPTAGSLESTLSLKDQILTPGSGINALSTYTGIALGGDFAGRCVVGGLVLSPLAVGSTPADSLSVEVSNSTYSSTFTQTSFGPKSLISKGAISGDTVNISQLAGGGIGSLNGSFGITYAPYVYLARNLQAAWTNLQGSAGNGSILSFYIIPNAYERSLAPIGNFQVPSPFRDEMLLKGVVSISGTNISQFTTDMSFGAGSTTTLLPIGPSHTTTLNVLPYGVGNKITLTYTVTGTYNAYDYSGKVVYTGTFFSESLTQQVTVTAART